MKSQTRTNVTVIDHPLAQHALARLRDYQTPTAEFRRRARELSTYLVYEAMRDLTTRAAGVETPMGQATGVVLPDYVVLAPILRAGLVISGVAQEIAPPTTRVYHIGLKRDEETLQAITYYNRLPETLPAETRVYILDPMLATGGSAVAAMSLFEKMGVSNIHMVSFLAAPEGLEKVFSRFPQVRITTAAVDKQLNEFGYIVPGLGDAGDRIFGT